MKKIFVIIVSLLAFTACQKDTNGYVINAEIEGVPDGKKVTLLTYDKGKSVVVDSTLVKSEKFKLKGSVPNPDIHVITVESLAGTLQFILENKKLNITVYKDSLGLSLITGSKENDIAQEYRKIASGFRIENDSARANVQKARMNNDSIALRNGQERIRTIRQNYIDYNINYAYENTNSVFSLLLLENLMHTKALAINEVNDIYNKYPVELQNSNPGKRIKDMLDKTMATEIGAIAPDFSGPDPEGNEIALNDVKGKVTIIDFWAAWCGPCRRENPNIVKVYNKYKDKGLEIIGVSLDGTPRQKDPKQAWLDAIEKDGLTWHQISHLNYFKGPIATKYNIRSIPAMFVLDSDGKIIAKNLRGPALEQKISELLN